MEGHEMRQPSKRISDYEADVRKRQPKVEKLLARARCISSECGALTLEERVIVAKRLDEISYMLRKPSGCHPT